MIEWEEIKHCPNCETEMRWVICFGDSHWACPACGETCKGSLLPTIERHEVIYQTPAYQSAPPPLSDERPH